MRRRPRTVDPMHEPPTRLRAYDPADWLPLVDPDEYHPDDWRNIRDGQPYGEPRFTFADWRTDQARHMWAKARHDWCDEHGWPGGQDFIDLMRQEVRLTIEGHGRAGMRNARSAPSDGPS